MKLNLSTSSEGKMESPAYLIRKTSVLMLAYYYPPDVQSGAARPHRIAKYLSRLGHPVEVFAAGPGADPVIADNVHRLRWGGVRTPKRDMAAFLERVLRQTLFVHDPGGTWAWRTVEYASRWMRETPRPVVISTAPPLVTHAAAYLMKRRYGVRWVADFRDPLAGNPFRPGGMPAFFDPIFERTIFKNADIVIANTDTVAELWKRKYPEWQEKIHVVWNGFDPEESLCALPLPRRDHKILAHIGSIYGDRDPDMLIQSLHRLLRHGMINPGSLCVQFIGPKAGEFKDPDAVQALISSGCLHVENPLPRAEAQHRMATSDALLLLDVISDSAGLQVPAKLFEYVRIGRPIVACTTRNSPVDRILTNSGLHYAGLYKGAPADEMDRVMLDFLRAPSDPAPASDWFNSNFDGLEQARYISDLIS